MKHSLFKQNRRYLQIIRISAMAFGIFGILNLWIPHNEVWATAFNYSFTSGSDTHTIDPLSGDMSAIDYYDYYSADGHPAFGTEANTAFLWLWEDLTTEEVSLGIIFSSPEKGRKGSANISFGGIPADQWVVKDDSGDIWNDGSVGWRWWARHTDGGVIGGLGNSAWDIDITANSSSGISNWYFLSAGEDKHAHSLHMKEGITASASAQVPEPATFLLLGVGMMGFLARKIKRMGRGTVVRK